MRNRQRRLPKQNIAVSATLNIIKQACMIAFPLITYSYATRVLGTEGIGVYEFTLSIISYFSLLAALGINQYAVRDGAKYTENHRKVLEQAGNLRTQLDDFVSEVFSINMIMTVVSYIVLAVAIAVSPLLANYRKALLIYSLTVLFTTVGAEWINSLFEDYLYITLRYIAVSVLSIIALFTLVRTPSDLYWYIGISAAGPIITGILNILYLRQFVKIRFTFKVNFKKHWKSIFILFCNNIASVVYLNSDITVLRALTDEHTVGLYGVASKIYSLIKLLMNAAIFVTIPRFSMYVQQGLEKNGENTGENNVGNAGENIHDERYRQGLKNLLTPLLAVVAPASVGLALMAKSVIKLISGDDFIGGASSLSILGAALFFAVMACFLGYAIIMPFKLEKFFLITTTIAAVVNIVLNLILIPIIGLNAAALTTLLAEIMVFISLLAVSLKKVNVFSILDKRDVFTTFAGCLVVGGLCFAATRFRIERLPGIVHAVTFIAFAALSVLLYAVVLMLGKHSSVKLVLDIVKSKLGKK